MSLATAAGSANWDYGVAGIVISGIAAVTSYTLTDEYGTQVEGIGSSGEVGAFLFGKRKVTISAEGYAAAGNPPALSSNATISVGGYTGQVMKYEKTGSNQDFNKFKIEGIFYPNLGQP